jgi:hypothetical protein
MTKKHTFIQRGIAAGDKKLQMLPRSAMETTRNFTNPIQVH